MAINYINNFQDLYSIYEGVDHYQNCPKCNRIVEPKLIACSKTYDIDEQPYLTLVLECSNVKCENLYLISYEIYTGYKKDILGYVSSYPYNFDAYKDVQVEQISTSFIKIYNEALEAETIGFLSICGAGYRKSLEFLIKDFIIFINTDNQSFNIEEVRSSKSVVKLIKKCIDNPKIVTAAEKAFWIGNDETHYEREWEDMNLQDLKNLIELVIYHIKMELVMNDYTEKLKR
ncbi:hypothetical protein LZ480_13530 [Solibacillus sp. MA9]|uniref:DUF4145 domain-containing protein n=1 Tax=Solibacillus palustris TaxID=2908203 RepID=A0ABS9UEX3_9BACL|nr:hypothetical protein [Solibacillus sp. MA9]MCH7322897.1 hypothetical protein [Solibacillus sp. MA9]